LPWDRKKDYLKLVNDDRHEVKVTRKPTRPSQPPSAPVSVLKYDDIITVYNMMIV